MKYKDENENSALNETQQERAERREEFLRALLHEFTNKVTAVIGYSELAMHAIEDSHPAREWLSKICNHTKHLALLVRKLSALNQESKVSGRNER